MFPWRWLALLALIPLALSANAGVKVKLTQKGLDFGRELAVASLQKKLMTIKVPDISGKERVKPIGKVRYSVTEMRVVKLGLPSSAIGLVPGTGFSLTITNAFLSLHGRWRVKYLRFIKDRGSFDLAIKSLSITTSISLRSDNMGLPAVAMASCTTTLGGVSVKLHGGASWLYNLFRRFIEKGLQSQLQKKLCPLVAESVSSMNQFLKTVNVMAPVDRYAEIAYPMVSSPDISSSSIGLNLKGEFYNIGNHMEPPFSPAPFFLPNQEQSMLYIGLSAFTANSASFVYNKAGTLSLKITDDMVPRSSPIRLTTNTFGVLIPQIAKLFPGLMMVLQLKMTKDPLSSIEANKVTVDAKSSLTAYAILANTKLAPLFVLNLDFSVSARVNVVGNKLAGAVTLNRLDMSLGKSYVGDFKVGSLSNIFQIVLKWVVLPTVNVRLKEGFPLPSLGKINLKNTQLQILKGYIMIGTDLQNSG
ncbi:bactericidal permeability-increasing protein [Gadus morhua]|uniref:Bactericidal permeability-increasing protein n=1 Tax=Gadus morhua TaxID=8049 RepID=A0A8C4Z4V0_GADMO|nr:bactericidal permeability-increasing protein-like [Gadus morhua]